ncbi:MAG: hypothetical protein IPI12_14130 [Ignavibacteriales bacterium]|nr:hypothetical protein [Ignavibacteriales bacterium]
MWKFLPAKDKSSVSAKAAIFSSVSGAIHERNGVVKIRSPGPNGHLA